MTARAALGLAAVALFQASCVNAHPDRTAKTTAAAAIAPAHPPASDAPAASSGGSPGSPALGLREATFHYPTGPLGPEDVVVVSPVATHGERFPVLVTFHGRGESLKGPARGARGWVDDYGLFGAVKRLQAPPLTDDDLQGFVTADRLAEMNRGLGKNPYRGLVVVCPYLPDLLHGMTAFDDGPRFAQFIVEEVLPRVYKETPAIGTPATTGVDGVSLGGRAALAVGLSRPEAFGVIAAMQPAIDLDEVPPFADLAKKARAKSTAFRLRLLTSNGDYFLESTSALSQALVDRGLVHRFDVVTGPHSYEFNRGPGIMEMLLFHDRALRGVEVP